MLNQKGKRKLKFQGETFYWYIKKDKTGAPKIHIISFDKKLQLIKDFDREMILGPKDILEAIQKHYNNLYSEQERYSK